MMAQLRALINCHQTITLSVSQYLGASGETAVATIPPGSILSGLLNFIGMLEQYSSCEPLHATLFDPGGCHRLQE